MKYKDFYKLFKTWEQIEIILFRSSWSKFYDSAKDKLSDVSKYLTDTATNPKKPENFIKNHFGFLFSRIFIELYSGLTISSLF